MLEKNNEVRNGMAGVICGFKIDVGQFLIQTHHATLGTVASLATQDAWRSWLRRCAASRTVTGSISDGSLGFFNDLKPSGRTMALVSTQRWRQRWPVPIV
jgi:hypothetical protein